MAVAPGSVAVRIDVDAAAGVAAQPHLEVRAFLAVEFAQLLCIGTDTQDVQSETSCVCAAGTAARARIEGWIAVGRNHLSASHDILR